MSLNAALLSGVMFGVAALSLHLPSFFAVTIAVFAVVAFSGATHDIAADGVYMSELSTRDQAKYIGWQGAFYNLAKLVATGGLVWFAGWLYERSSAAGAASFDAYVHAWTVVLAILCGLLVLIGLYHAKMLPSGGAAAEKHSLREGLRGLREVTVTLCPCDANTPVRDAPIAPVPPNNKMRICTFLLSGPRSMR